MSRLSQISSYRKDGFLFTSVVIQQFTVSCRFSVASACCWACIPMLSPSTRPENRCLSPFLYSVLYFLTRLCSWLFLSRGTLFWICVSSFCLTSLSPTRLICLQKSQNRDIKSTCSKDYCTLKPVYVLRSVRVCTCVYV